MCLCEVCLFGMCLYGVCQCGLGVEVDVCVECACMMWKGVSVWSMLVRDLSVMWDMPV